MVNNPPEQPQEQAPQRVSPSLPMGVPGLHASQQKHAQFTKVGLISLLALIGVLILLFSGLLLANLSQSNAKTRITAHVSVSPPTKVPSKAHATATSGLTPSATPDQDTSPTPTPFSPLSVPSNQTVPALQLPPGRFLLYEQPDGLYLASTAGQKPQKLTAQGYLYNPAVHPLLTPSGQLLYSGNGLWVMDIFGGTTSQLAMLAPGQVITSMALSNDGTTIAWSTEPVDGTGYSNIYAGPLAAPTLVYEQSATACPCLRIFSFMNGTSQQSNNSLLLTDDRGSHEAEQHGLWMLDLTQAFKADPQLILPEEPQQGPLALAPYENVLLYSSNEGIVSDPTDNSVPSDIAALTYANSLAVATLANSPPVLGPAQVILPVQHNLSNSASYHWVTTPVFTLDGHNVIYVEFSSDSTAPFDRHNALYIASMSSTGTHLYTVVPQLLATSSARLVELGPWLNNHILTFYADGALYALDIQNGAVVMIAQTAEYARSIAIVGFGSI